MPELGDISALLQRYYYSGDPEEYYMQPIADGRGGLIVLAGYNGLYVIQDRESFLRAYSHVVKNGYVKRGSRLRAVLTALPIWGLLVLVTAIYEEVSFWDWTCLAPVLYMASLYEKALQKLEKDDSDHREFGNRLICVLFILLILVSAWSILCAPKGTEDRRTAARLALIVWAFAGTCVWGYAYFYCKDNMAKEQYSPRIIRAVLQNRPESVDAEFYSYSKGQIEKLITEYAARYDNNVLERRN